MADLVTIQLLFNPALPLSTYNIRCISVRQASDREETADAEKRAITGCVIENTQRALTESADTKERCSMRVCMCVSVCACVCNALSEKALMNKV